MEVLMMMVRMILTVLILKYQVKKLQYPLFGVGVTVTHHEWDKFADNPNFDVYINGTLVIKKVLPVDNARENVYSLRPEELYRDKKYEYEIIRTLRFT